MIAGLPMYLVPENRQAHAALWSLIRDNLRRAGIAAPEALDETLDPQALWSRSDLVLSHICNLPYRRYFRDRVTLIGASDYGLDGCEPGYYRSLFVVARDHPAQSAGDLAGARMAYNSADSHSGWGAPADWAEMQGMRFRPVLETGSHASALAAVIAGRAEFAAIDAQSFRQFQKYRDDMDRIQVIGATAPSPGQSFITRKGEDPAVYFSAVSEAIAALDPEERTILGLKGIVRLPDAAYDAPLPVTPAQMLAMAENGIAP